MLRDAGVRTKLLAVLAIPTLLLVVVTALFVGGQVSAARKAGQVRALTDVAIQVNRVVHSLQEERSATLGYLQDPSSGNEAQMQGQRQFTNQQLRTLRGLVAASPVDQMSEAVKAAVARSAAGHDELAGARASVDAGRFFATETDVFYTKVIRNDLDLPGVVASSGTTELAQRLQAYEALSTAIEYASHERDLVEGALLRGSLTESDYAQTAALVAQQRQALADFQRNAPAPTYAALDNALADAENTKIDRFRRDLPDLLKGRDVDYGASVEWVGAANSRIGPMTDSETGVVSDIATVAADTQDRQEQRAVILLGLSVAGLLTALLLAVQLARRITRPLRRLTVAAGEIGDELPHMVERMQIPGEGPGVVVEPIPVESRDEIGRLAEAFNTVNDVTVQVAQEQAALRASIAEMFVNVARRNQVLLGRQLSQLDTMEAREEDPDVLDNLFKLDHLATRMRRNAESLLVLAGIDSTRRLRRPLPLSDVIRTAVGEIEAFDRIDLSMTEDPDVSGRHALTVAHLLAELLENATHFSNPETRVVVSATVTGHGVDLTVTDYGLGMSEEEIAEANDKIAHPPVAEIAVSQRLGLFVVGRLAARLGATVVLRRGRAAGTVVAVTLPTTVFEGMQAPEPVVPAEADTPDFGTADAAPDPVAEVPVAEADVESVAESVDELRVEELTLEQPEDGPVVEVELVEPVVEEASVPVRRGLFRRRSRSAETPENPESPETVEPAEGAELSEAVEPVELVEPVEAAEASVDEAVEVAAPADEPVEGPEPETEQPVAELDDSQTPARKGLFRRRSRSAERPADTVEPPMEPVVEAEPVVDAQPVAEADAVAEAEHVAEPEHVAEAEPVDAEVSEVVAAEPVDEPVSAAALFAQAVAEEPQPQPEPQPEPYVPLAYAPAVDILPSQPHRGGGMFGRHRRPAQQPTSAAPAPAARQPAAPAWRPAEPVAAPPAEPVTAPVETAPVAEAPVADREPAAELRTPPPAVDGPPLEAPAVPLVQRRPAPEPVAVASAAALPTRSPAPVPAEPEPAAEPVPPSSDLDRMAAQAELASSALSELRGLYEPSYRPTPAGPAPESPSAGLTRRTPKASAAAAPTAPPPPSRTRTAAEVRGMLSGFRAGVERGRESAPADHDQTDDPNPTR